MKDSEVGLLWANRNQTKEPFLITQCLVEIVAARATILLLDGKTDADQASCAEYGIPYEEYKAHAEKAGWE